MLSSAKDITLVKIAVEICSNLNLKKEVLCELGNEKRDPYDRKEQWNKKVKEKATAVIKEFELPEKLHEKLLGVVLSVGFRMLTWAVYHEGNFGFSREYSINFLNSSLFTQNGLIDHRKVAEKLLSDKCLSIEQMYKLSCLYCFTDRLHELYIQMGKEEKEKYYNPHQPEQVNQPGLVTFWTYCLRNEVDKIKGEKNVDEYMLEKAIESGSKVAVEYCLNEKKLKDKQGVLVHAAAEAVRNRILTEYNWIVFWDQNYDIDNKKQSWVPCDYYIEILCYLLLKMKKDEQIEFLRRDMECNIYRRYDSDRKRVRVLEYFLDWPYQDFFLKCIRLMWEFLPKKNYAVLLLRICTEIECEDEAFIHGSKQLYNYRGLLKEFWCQSPYFFKKFVLHDEKKKYNSDCGDMYDTTKTTICVALLTRLLALENFTNEDKENIKLILSSATNTEKVTVLYSQYERLCIELLKEESWEILDRFVNICFLSKNDANNFMTKLCFTKEVQRFCIYLIRTGDWIAFETFMKWSDLPEMNLNQFKKELIYSEDGIEECSNLISCYKDTAVNNFIHWCFSLESEIVLFRRFLVFTDAGLYKCADLLMNNKLEVLCEFISSCHLTEEKIKELKKCIAYRTGCRVLKRSLFYYSDHPFYNEDEQLGRYFRRKTKFVSANWELVEMFLTWCFSAEEEISDFKKNELFRKSGVDIHFNLIKSNRWEEAETFFAWLNLSPYEIRDLKKRTLFNHVKASVMFLHLIYSEEGDKEFVDFGNKTEAIELFLRWYLTDKEIVLEFVDKFKSAYAVIDEDDEELKLFDLMIELRLKDIDEEKMEVKRKSETFPPPNKRRCHLKLENSQNKHNN